MKEENRKKVAQKTEYSSLTWDEPKNFIPKLSEPIVMVLVIIASVLGAIVGMQVLVNTGVAPDTSVVGALIAVLKQLPDHGPGGAQPLHAFRYHIDDLLKSGRGAARLCPVGIIARFAPLVKRACPLSRPHTVF